MAEAAAGQAQEAPLVRAVEEHLRDGERDHTHASANIAAGVDVVYISRQLGHANPSITMDVYADLVEAREKARVSRNLLEASGLAASSEPGVSENCFHEGSGATRSLRLSRYD